MYEAAALGLSRLRRDEWADQIAPGTLIEITVREPATTHTISPSQIRRWCDGIAVSPDELQKRKTRAGVDRHLTEPCRSARLSPHWV